MAGILLRKFPLVWLGFIVRFSSCLSASLNIKVPSNVVSQDTPGRYRLDYWPPEGFPVPNSTFLQTQIQNGIVITQAQPGTKYSIHLYFSNDTYRDMLAWSSTVNTAPDPPTDLSASVSGTYAQLAWNNPEHGTVSHYKLRVIPYSEIQNSIQNIEIEDSKSQFRLRDLVAGASYDLELYSIYENVTSLKAASEKITTIPNSPGRFIVWFRNETTMLVLWQPPYPPGIFSQYKVTINPPHAHESVLTLGKNDGPSQAAFYGLSPGHPYNISIQTISGSRVSVPTTAQYRTIPLAPRNLTFDYNSLTSKSFIAKWNLPQGVTEFDRYVVSNGKSKQSILRGEPTSALFSEGLEPGKTYQVEVKAVSFNVFSWPSKGNITTRPLPVIKLVSTINKDGEVFIKWQPTPDSEQDHYEVTYQEQENYNRDSFSSLTNITSYTLPRLLPGRNYSISISAVSNGVIGEKSTVFQVTKPSTPIIENLVPVPEGLNISWKSDVNSHQDKYIIVYTQNDTGTTKTIETYLPFAELKNLYPGAIYKIQIYSISHNVQSDPHQYYQAVFPNPVRNLTITYVTAEKLEVSWLPPYGSHYDGFILKYRAGNFNWSTQNVSPNQTWYSLTGLLPGYRYIIQLTAVRSRVESWKPISVEETLPPAKTHAGDVQVLMGSHNASLLWHVSTGHVDNYIISWWPSGDASKKKSTRLQGDNSTSQVRVPILGLRPGEQYVFEIYSIANGLESAKIKVDNRTHPLLISDMLFVNEILHPSSLTITYTPTPASSTKFDLYRCHLINMAEQDGSLLSEQEHLSTDPNRSFLFRGLVPGRLYQVTMWTVSGGVTSSPRVREVRLFPAPVTLINATLITNTEMRLVWNEPAGDYDGFDVFYQGEGEPPHQELVANREHALQALTPHRNYSITIRTLSGSRTREMRRSNPLSVVFVTAESVPGRVAVFETVHKKPRQVHLRWSLPEELQNGVLQSYTVSYGEKGGKAVKVRNFSPQVAEGVIGDLEPGRTFTFQIQGRTRVGYGATTTLDVTTPIWPPPQPNTRVFPTEVSKNATSIRVRFRRNYFSDENGKVSGYSIVVAEDDTKDSTGLELPNWQDVQSYSVWPPFQVNMPYNPFSDNTSVEDFTIGTDESCTFKCARMPASRCYCNGPLRPGSSYSVKIRAFTRPDLFSDTAYSHKIQTERTYSGLLVAVFVPLLLILLLALLIVLMRRRHVGPFRSSKEMRRHKDDDMSLRDSIIETSRPVKLKDFQEHYRFMSADSDIRFSEEYEDLKHVGRDQPCTAADYPCNRPKNRFTNILPYDHSRFKLQPSDDEEGSDYINANYVPGFNSPREFIVSQGPLHSTRDDFWRMVWESNSRAVVMLTRCVEKGREKCDHYWPYDTQPQYYGEIQVVVLNQTQLPNWTVSEFRVTRGDLTRVVKHFHFTTWPDFGVPEPAQVLVRFVRAFRERVPYDQRPIIAHCSAGVGRSGTFIALDRAIQHIRQYDYIDIFGQVYEMRKERVLMVQTEVQYICIHTSLQVVLDGKENDDICPLREVHTNIAYDDDEGIVESGM